jgi:hypothetical protein
MDTNPKPRMAKAHSRFVAYEYIRLGWTLAAEFREEGDDEPYEYFFTWDHSEDPRFIDWKNLLPPKDT